MQKFYIYNKDQQEGPYSIDELKELKITRETMVWFDGINDWKKAKEITELNEIFKNVPPQFISNNNTQPVISTKENKSLRNKALYIFIFTLISLGAIFTYILVQNQKKQDEFQIQIEEQNRILNEQNIKLQKQDSIENSRIQKEQKRKQQVSINQRKAKLEALKYEYDEAISNLRAAKIKINELQQFQLLRTTSEREQQIQYQLEIIRNWENEVERLENEINSYK